MTFVATATAVVLRGRRGSEDDLPPKLSAALADIGVL